MEQDLPYQVEYAKSGRASCKICKIPISQGSLRLARMIQSPHFDGKVPTWHHYACFFKKYMPKSCAEIGKFDAIRWDDQEKIREKIGGDSVDGAGGDQKENCTVNTDFSIEYSKSSRAKCRSCEEKIEKDVVRVAKMELPDEPKKGVGLVPRWHHLDCFVAARDDLGAEELTPGQIPGFAALKEDDREDILRKFGVPKKKKVIKKEDTEAPDQKPDLEKLKEKEVLKKQSKRFWQVRDHLQTEFELKTVRALLELNGEDSAGGEAQVLDRCSDGILFGNLEPCPECNQKRIRYSAEKGYVCHGDLTEWTNCTYRTFTPKRTVWKVTKEYKEGTFLENMKLKVVERKFPTEVIMKANNDAAFGNQGSLASEVPGKPLHDKKIVLIGKLKESRAAINTKVESLGGTITDTVNRQCFCSISSPGEVLKSSAKMTKAETCNIPVVAEEYLDAIANGGAEVMLSQFAIAPWGSRGESATETTKSGAVKRKNSAAEEEGASSSKKQKVTLKGGAEVDPAFEKAESCHLVTINGEVYTAVLGLVNLVRGSNTYYKLQLLQHDTKKSRYYVFRSWGRVGTTIGSTKTEQFNSREDAVENFLEVYYEKTGNFWCNRKNFVKRPNQFYPLDIDYGQDDELVKSAIEPGSRSKLAEPLKELIKFIFDIEAMKDALVEFEIDLKKMPLGKLSRKQIETAYSCLTESLKYVEGGVIGGKVLDVSNRFYTLIPHDFGLDTPPLLNNKDLIDLKIKMLDSLLEIEVAYNICKQAKEDEDPVDVHYQSLNTAMNVVSKDSEEFKMICTYVSNTHAKTHSNYTLDVEEVFDVSRKGERQQYRPFKDLHNRKLLWHGSRSTNFVGILSQGLRIAPPEAPVTGYMFGKGVYFADMASKSANYCNTNRNNNTGLMLLCEVALGNEYQLTASEHIVKLPPGKHSCKGVGRTCPDPSLEKKLPDGVVVPLGTGVEDKELDSTLLYNEYIIYDTAQCNMKYLVKMKFNYKY